MRKKIFIIISFLTGMVLMISCLKDKVGLDWPSAIAGKMYAEVWQGGYASLALAPVGDTVTFKFLVNIASDLPPTQDIMVKLKVNPTAMIHYDSLAKANYQIYPYIQIVDSIMTIKAGTQNAYCHVKIWNADSLNACNNYMAPISIYSASGGVIPADPTNMGSRLMSLPISNPWAGTYHLIGYRLHPSAGYQFIETDAPVTTVNCSTVMTVYFGVYTAYNVVMQVTTDPIMVLGIPCFKVNVSIIDPATGTTAGGAGQAGAYTTFTGNASDIPIPLSNDVNYYDPFAKKFVLNAWYNAAAPRIMYEWLTRE
ncbi:MAG: DUF1735 domain-containing protein [Bacteroidales bacterium]|jgi:hypothetical protein